MDLNKYKHHFIVMTEAGFIAVNQADEDAATKLFKAASLLEPKNLLPKVGMGYLNLCKLQLKVARQIFEEILEEEPNNEMAKTFLGLSLSLNPAEVKHGEKILEESAKHSHDPIIKDLATNALDFVHKFVIKSESPMESHSKEKK
jgi:hypothetical protein